MNIQNKQWAMVIDSESSIGLIANASAVVLIIIISRKSVLISKITMQCLSLMNIILERFISNVIKLEAWYGETDIPIEYELAKTGLKRKF
ncbi:hypothetical protein [Domibacillus mangrovi]|uniref:Uncharacterized protein n=1 Tax=Domibacillus mangrovi TaxID=1714354 RepID=A0A1Q5P0E3_9BACI|nr:hypothetical protein [Domibacillus mangrovi]OKL35735.1 hypothetical protein BLL40_14245 [Domibacillus mangrovi]